jgi:ankyrin repeat protein
MSPNLKCLSAALIVVLVSVSWGVSGGRAPSSDLRYSLIDAAYNDDTRAVATLLAQRSDVNAVGEDGFSALAWAAMRSNVEIVSLLLGAGADVNLVNEYGVGPLSLAIENCSLPIVRLLLEKGANPNLARESGETPLMTAVRLGRTDVVKLLIDHSAEVNGRDKKFGQTALMWAAGHPEIVRLLLNHKADLHAVSTKWDVNLPMYGPPFRTLGATGVPWTFQGSYMSKRGGQNALHFAVLGRDFESTQLLLDAGMDVNAGSADGTPPLLLALYKWRTEDGRSTEFMPDIRTANFLLDRGAKVDVADGAGYTPLHAAVITAAGAGGTGGRSKKDTGSGLRVTGPGRAGGPLLQVSTADKAEAIALVRRLLDAGADPNAQVNYSTPGPIGALRINPAPPRSSPFHFAAASQNIELIRLLADHGGNPNLMRSDGHTPFTIAVDANDLEATKEMVARGADLKLRYNPADMIPDRKEAKALPRTGQTIMHLAALAFAVDVIPYLSELGVPLAEKNALGETPLILADNQEVVEVALALEGAVRTDGRIIPRDSRTTDLLKKLYAKEGLPIETKPMEGYSPPLN